MIIQAEKNEPLNKIYSRSEQILTHFVRIQ